MDSENNKNSLILNHKFLVFIIVISLLVSFYLFFIKNKSNSLGGQDNSIQKNISDAELNNQITDLNNRSKITIPLVSSEKGISSKDLPVEILSMLGSNITYNKVNSVEFDSGKTGYDIEFSSPYGVRDVYFAFWKNFKNEKWNVIYGSRYGESGIFNVENSNYQVKILLSIVNPSKTSAKVTVIKK